MSLIQQALDKVGRLPKPLKETSPSDSSNVKFLKNFFHGRIPLPKEKRNFFVSNRKILMRSAAAIAILLAFFCLWEFLKSETYFSPSKLAAGISGLAADKSAPETPFVLTGITVSGNIPLALINNQVVGAGDLLEENARVEKIVNKSVELSYQGRRITLSL